MAAGKGERFLTIRESAYYCPFLATSLWHWKTPLFLSPPGLSVRQSCVELHTTFLCLFFCKEIFFLDFFSFGYGIRAEVIHEVDKKHKKKDVAQEFGTAPMVLSLWEKTLKSFSEEWFKARLQKISCSNFSRCSKSNACLIYRCKNKKLVIQQWNFKREG